MAEREKLTGIISHYLEYIYGLTFDKIADKYNLVLSLEFWYFTTLGIFTLVIFFTGLSFWMPISFFIGAFLVFLADNSNTLRRHLIPREKERIYDFLEGIKSKNKGELLKFLRKYSLKPNDLREVFCSKYGIDHDVHKFILKFQKIDIEVFRYVFFKGVYKSLTKKQIIAYIYKCRGHLPKTKFKKLSRMFKDPDIIRMINMRYYFFLENNWFYKFLMGIWITIRDFFKYGYGKFLVIVAALYFAYVLNPLLITKITVVSRWYSLVLGFFVLTIILRLILKLLFYAVDQVFYLFAPIKQ